MLRTLMAILAVLSIAGLSACDGDSKSDTDAGPDGSTDGDTDTDSDSDTDTDPNCPQEGQGSFDENDPGINMTFSLMTMYMMGQPIAMALGTVMPSAREDFDWEDTDEIPMDTCVVDGDSETVPECSGPEDCAPEQECVPETDDSGNPIPGTEHCVTPRDLMDVGPMTVDGFVGGSIELVYNPGQSGAYTTAGGDGQIDPSLIAYDTDYSISGGGDPGQGLDGFWGDVYFPEQLEITSPDTVTTGMGMPALEVDPDAELALEWSGTNSSGYLDINLAGGSMSGDGGSITCRVADDGAFTIPANMVQAASLGDMAFFNKLIVTRYGTGQLCGVGMTIQETTVQQMIMLDVQKAAAE